MRLWLKSEHAVDPCPLPNGYKQEVLLVALKFNLQE